jgi:hypothetical protein
MDGIEAGVLMGWTRWEGGVGWSGCRTSCLKSEEDTKRQIALIRM